MSAQRFGCLSKLTTKIGPMPDLLGVRGRHERKAPLPRQVHSTLQEQEMEKACGCAQRSRKIHCGLFASMIGTFADWKVASFWHQHGDLMAISKRQVNPNLAIPPDRSPHVPTSCQDSNIDLERFPGPVVV